MANVILYTKPGCHLCDDAKDVLLRVRREIPFSLQEVNIRTDAGLYAAYGERIPVVNLNGEDIFDYNVNEARLRELLKEVNN
jgi:glutaredoxin